MATVRIRNLLREDVNLLCQKVDMCLGNPDKDDELDELFSQLGDKASRLFNLDNTILGSWETVAEDGSGDGDENFVAEWQEMERFRNKILACKSKIERCRQARVQAETHREPLVVPGTSLNEKEPDPRAGVKTSFRLPELQLKQFSGDIREWIPFWGQFKKIHENPNLDSEDKFQYLLQSTTPGSKARSLVESFPPSAGNYAKAIDQLKSRFAKDHLIIEVYIRELLSLIINQVISKGGQSNLADLLDKLETQLQALETLGVTTDKFSAILLPLVESALPTNILRLWERNKNSQNLNSSNNKILNSLLDFLKLEVESEQRINLAASGFGVGNESGKFWSREKEQGAGKGKRGFNFVEAEKVNEGEGKVPTAASILSMDRKKDKDNDACIFCEKNSHLSSDCFKAQHMTYEQKKEIVIKKQACYQCLKIGHSVSYCKNNGQSRCAICQRKHHIILCPDLPKKKGSKQGSGDTSGCCATETSRETGKSEIYLETLAAKLKSEGKERTVRIFLDSGSQKSYIRKEVAEQMNLKRLGEEEIKLGLFGGGEAPLEKKKFYEVTLESLKGDIRFKFKVLEQQKICATPPKIREKELLQELKLKGIELSDAETELEQIDVLLGVATRGKLLTGNMINLSCGLTVSETKLGWIASGTTYEQSSSYDANGAAALSIALHVMNLEAEGELKNSEIKDLWALESLGIKDPFEPKGKHELDDLAKEHFESTVKIREDGRYEIELPWIEEKEKLGTNYAMARKRLETTVKKLEGLNRINDYDKVFKEWLNLGIIEPVVHDKNNENACHYLPHRAVIRESSNTTKVRPVFDASAKEKGKLSLNQCLAKGPNMLELIPPLLIRFRLHQYAVSSDIEKAFLQISIDSKDRDYLRFLWYENKKIKTFRHARVVFGVKPSPFLLNAVIVHHLNRPPKYLQETAEKLKSSFYVDNCIYSVKSKAELERFIKESIEIMSLAKFNLREWVYSLDDSVESAKVLGLKWFPKSDHLSCQIGNAKVKGNIPTKRILLSVMQTVFDPLGFFAPCLLLPKLLLQEICKAGLDYDEELPNEIEKRFNNWQEQLKILEGYKIPRWVFDFNCAEETWELHMFCDASTIAYAACVYIRGANDLNEVSVKLVMGKTRVGPSKNITVARLELIGATIGCRLLNSVKKAIGIPDIKCYLWCDSMITLAWIKNEGPWSTFVKNRKKEINVLSKIEDWRFVPGASNPADIASRGASVEKVAKSSWWNGPDWLRDSPELWPIRKENENLSVETERANLICLNVEYKNEFYKKIFRYFSKYTKQVRMIAWMLRWKQLSKKIPVETEISGEEYEKAEKVVIRLIQEQHFGSKMVSADNIDCYLDNEKILRVRTKLSEEDKRQNTPYLLPGENEVVKRLMRQEHLILKHAGVQTVLNSVREKFWVLRARRAAKTIIKKCIPCQRFKAKAIEAPPGDLPLDRTKLGSAFQVIGIDLMGPLHLKDRQKIWVVLYTCAVYRAVHLEVARSLSTDDFLLTLRRFIARRGRPCVIYSDNGTNFKGANNLFETIDWIEIVKETGIQKIKWKFIPPTAAWWGGYWERLIKVTKELLRRNLGKACVDLEEFNTLLTEIEGVINQRPLTYVADNPEELRPICPAHFIQDIAEIGTEDLNAIDAKAIKSRRAYLQQLRKNIKERFKKEYIAQLVHKRRKEQYPIVKKGDVVLIQSEKHRSMWELGRIMELYPGKDGKIRVAKVKTSSGGEIIRPIQKLHKLEMDDNLSCNEETGKGHSRRGRM